MSRKMTRRHTGSDSIARGDSLDHALLEAQPPSFSSWHVPEPALVFGNARRSVDPKTGLTLFGPADMGTVPLVLVSLIGTGSTIDQAQRWFERVHHSVFPSARRVQNRRLRHPDPILFPPFPGLSGSFRCDIKIIHTETLTDSEVQGILSIDGFQKRVTAAVDMVARYLRVLHEKSTRPHVVVVAMPPEIEKACSGGGRRRGPQPIPLTPRQRSLLNRVKRLQEAGHQFLFDMPTTMGIGKNTDVGHQSFHRYLKVRAMAVGLPVQLIWPGTFDHGPGTQDEATIAWNLITGMYYKAGGTPWRVTGLDPGTCYVGVSFYRELGAEPTLNTSLAQAFAEHGDGLVLRGEPFAWSRQDEERHGKSPHLDRTNASRLLRSLLSRFQVDRRQLPTRVVIHKTSRFLPEELAGFREALDSIPYHDFVTLAPSDLRFLRLGDEPPLRGTVFDVGGGRHVIYTRGYVPFLRVYPGLRVPLPWEVREHHGNGSMRLVCAEILALTKMNWNCADFSCGEPMTLRFSKEVGLILAEMPKGQEPATSYRAYM